MGGERPAGSPEKGFRYCEVERKDTATGRSVNTKRVGVSTIFALNKYPQMGHTLLVSVMH